MKIVRSLDEIRGNRKLVLTVGTFDGVHRGHQALLKRLVADAKKHRAVSVVLTFEQHPRKVVHHHGAVEVLNATEYKLTHLKRAGVEICCLIDFNERIRHMDKNAFLERYLPPFRVDTVVVGYDFRFGKNREGTAETIRDYCGRYGVRCLQLAARAHGGNVISSNRIRSAVKRGDLAEAEACLGRPYSVVGTVVHGNAVGRSLGFPTANVQLDTEVLPPDGVYGVEIRLMRKSRHGYYECAGRKRYRGVAYRGPVPEFTGGREGKPVVEVFIFGFRGNLYRRSLEVMFRVFLRKPQRVADPVQLVRLIGHDIAEYKK